MTSATSISVTLATYKAIEAQRLSFGETHDAIIRRALAERNGRRALAAGRMALASRGAPRRRGRVSVELFGRAQPALNLKDAYLVILTGLSRHKAALLQLLACEGSDRRRWVARSAEGLFVTAPHLAREHAHQIAPDWFVDTNVSRAQIHARLARACELSGYRFGIEIKLLED